MTTNNDWPGKPGVPLNPERDGWHWLEDTVDGVGTGHIEVVYYAAWSVPIWYRAGNRSPMKKPENWIYRGPCLTPYEVAALQRRVAELEAQNEMLRHATDKLRAMLTKLNAQHEPLQRAFITAVELLNDAALEGGKDE